MQIVLVAGSDEQNVVGESHHREALGAAIGRQPRGEWEHVMTWAVLVPEPSNPYDPDAVRVFLAEHHVGHLPREVAASCAPLWLTAGAALCPARARGRTEDIGWGVTLLVDYEQLAGAAYAEELDASEVSVTDAPALDP